MEGGKKVSKPNCCHTIKPKLVGQSKGKVNVFNLATRQLLSLKQPRSICPISFNLILQQDNYDLHLAHEPLSPPV